MNEILIKWPFVIPYHPKVLVKTTTTCLILILFTTNGLALPTDTATYSQVRLQMPEPTFEPVVGMAETEIMDRAGVLNRRHNEQHHHDHPMANVKRTTDNDEEILCIVNSRERRARVQTGYDTLESLIEWVNKSPEVDDPLRNDIQEN